MHRAVPSLTTRVSPAPPYTPHHRSLRVVVTTPYYHSVRTRIFYTTPTPHQCNHPEPHHTFHSTSKPNAPSLSLNHDTPIFLKPTVEEEKLASRTTEPAGNRGSNESHIAGAAAYATDTSSTQKNSLWIRFKNEMVHYWHGTKLLGTEIKISSKLANRIFHGEKLTRREQQQLRRTTGDLVRLIPFSVFIIVPFMEFLLPVALRLFPNMLPSTFEDSFAADEKKRKLLKMRLEVAKFLQQTIEARHTSKAHTEQTESVKEFSAFFKKIRTTGEQASTEELIRVAKLFPNELMLDNLTRLQLLSMCRYMNLNAFGTDAFLRYQIRAQMNSIKGDDKLIMAEGLDSLTQKELFHACQARGMCTLNVTPERMKSELAQWLELHLTHSIPSTLLILSRAFSFSHYPTSTSTSTTTTTTTTTSASSLSTTVLATETSIHPIAAEALQATLSSLPETLVTQTQIRVSELEGSPATAKQKLDVLKQQEELIAKEKLQEDTLKAVFQAARGLATESIAHDLNAILGAKAGGGGDESGAKTALPLPPLSSHFPGKTRSASELMAHAQATATHALKVPHAAAAPEGTTHLTHPLDDLAISAVEDRAHLTKEQLLELREALGIMSSRSGVLEAREELEQLKKHRAGYNENLSKQEYHASSSSRRLGIRLDAMISRLDMELLEYSSTLAPALQQIVATERGEISTADIASALRIIKHAPEDAAIAEIVKRLDVDGDGLVLLSQIWELADRVAHDEGTGILLQGGRHVRHLLGDLLTSEKSRRKEEGGFK